MIRNYLAREDYLRAAQKLQDYMQFNTSFAEVKAKFQLEVPWGNLADLMNLSIDRKPKESYRRARQLLGGRTSLIDKENEQQESIDIGESEETVPSFSEVSNGSPIWDYAVLFLIAQFAFGLLRSCNRNW